MSHNSKISPISVKVCAGWILLKDQLVGFVTDGAILRALSSEA